MATDVINSFDSIEEKLIKAKSNLKGLNDNIRRIIGREPADNQLRLEIVFVVRLKCKIEVYFVDGFYFYFVFL